MPVASVAGTKLWFEAPEAGRYQAPLLVLPGMFQSFECWRSMTSMLAHRGWEVYGMSRWCWDRDGEPLARATHWDSLIEQTAAVCEALEGQAIAVAADVAAGVAVEMAHRGAIAALALFAPEPPRAVFERVQRCRGWRERWLPERASDVRDLPAGVAAPARPAWACPEPVDWFRSLATVAPTTVAAHDVPTAVFEGRDDPLVESEGLFGWAASPAAKVASTAVQGRWWPATAGVVAAGEVHRFVVLTLGDRVVDFPDAIVDWSRPPGPR